MPYKKRTYRRKRNYGSSGWSTASRALSTAGTALALARSVKALVNTEYKVRQQGATLYSVGNTGTTQCVTTIAQGTDDSDRIGRSIKVKSLQMKGHINWNSSSTQVAQTVRLLVFSYKGCNGAEPATFSELLEGTGVYDFRNTDYGKQFTVYYDKVFTLSSQQKQHLIHWGKYNMNHHCEYIGTSAAITAMGAGAVFYAFISDDNTNKPQLDLTFRTRYIDN